MNAFTAAFDRRYGSEPPLMPFVNWPIVDETTTIRACPARRSAGSSACVSPNGASTFTANARLDVRAARVGDPAAAEDAGVVHEHVERRRQRERPAPPTAATPSSPLRSPHSGSPPRSVAARRASASVRAWHSSRAPSDPSAAAIAGPSPRPVPVTSAVCPSRSIPVA